MIASKGKVEFCCHPVRATPYQSVDGENAHETIKDNS